MTDWTEQVAVISGAASGIGAGLARHASQLGMVVIATDLDREGLEALGVDHIKCVNVADPEAVEALAADVFERYGKVNLLFNNAGVLVDGKSWERSVEDWRWSLNVNVMGVVHGIRSFVPRMLEQGEAGRVINTSSIGGLLGGGAYMGPYQGTKHCITSITETLYNELSLEEAPISASVLCPAEVATGIWESDRLRTDQKQNELGSDAEKQFHDLVAGAVAAGLSPEVFAGKVFAAIEDDKFWLLPQPEFKSQYQLRFDSIMSGDNPPTMAEIMASYGD